MEDRVHSGFTLIEILIVVVILGILSAILIPRFASASEDSRRAAEQSTVQILRNQITFYKVQHLDTNPSVGGFWANMLSKTDANGNVGSDATVYKYGPYFSQEPRNPHNGLSTVQAVSAPGAIPTEEELAVNSVGFLYDAETGRIWATKGR